MILYGDIALFSDVGGSDRLYGEEGNDTLGGGEGDDFLFGENGNDTLGGGAGDDSLWGGAGDDELYGDTLNVFLESGEGGGDRIYAGDGNDSLTGSVGNDVLYGDAGNDLLKGAGSASERLPDLGVGEIDTLTGGAGANTFQLWDIFRYSGAHGSYYVGRGNQDYALITDFDQGKDVIELTARQPIPGVGETQVDYSLGASPQDLPGGTAIFANNIGTQPELVAILQDVDPASVSLSEPYFNLVTPQF
jgi:Ca2+-binding RTX toxin-like protein